MAFRQNFMSGTTIAILDTIPFGIYYCDASTVVRYINKPYADYIGLDPKDIIGRKITDVMPGSRANAVIESGKAELYDNVSVFQDREILVNRVPVTDGNGEIKGFISQLFSVGKGDWQGIWKTIEQAGKTLRYLQKEAGQVHIQCGDVIVGKSPALLRFMEKLNSYASTQLPVLITGGTGVGKELFANAIHKKSPYANGPIVTINCGSIPAELIESELFGYAPGAFTDALRSGKAGQIELADRGTLFLDELGDLPLKAQATLLRAIETRKVQRIGSHTPRTVDFRLVAATNRDIESMIKLGQFREDFYYRINILRLRAPSLSERVEDIPDLVQYVLAEAGKDKVVVTDEAMNFLKAYPWPGNIRELRNVVMCTAISSKDGTITEDVLADILNRNSHDLFLSTDKLLCRDKFVLPGDYKDAAPSGSTEDNATLAKRERCAIIEALRANQYNRAKTARALGIARTTLYRKLKEYSIPCDASK